MVAEDCRRTSLADNSFRPTQQSAMNAPVRMSCSAILFDLDGVLVNSAECVERTWRRWAVEHDLDPARVIEVAHGRRTIETIKAVAPHLAAANEAAALESGQSNTTDGVYKVPGVRELLERLPPNSWAIVTSGTRDLASARIRHTGIPMPRILVCADEIQRGKPDPEGYLAAAKLLGKSPAECVVIEDAPTGIEAARAAGMRAIAVSGTYSADALTMADLIVPHLRALNIRTPGNGSPLEITREEEHDEES